jgi:hypothetical protein
MSEQPCQTDMNQTARHMHVLHVTELRNINNRSGDLYTTIQQSTSLHVGHMLLLSKFSCTFFFRYFPLSRSQSADVNILRAVAVR